MRSDFIGNYSVFDVLFVRKSQMLLGGNVTKHCATVPAYHGGAYGTRDVVVTRRDIRCERAKSVKWCLMAPLQLVIHVLFNQMHRDMTRAFIHHLASHIPGYACQLALCSELGKLRLVISVSD